jgi:hypothetical protein
VKACTDFISLRGRRAADLSKLQPATSREKGQQDANQQMKDGQKAMVFI